MGASCRCSGNNASCAVLVWRSRCIISLNVSLWHPILFPGRSPRTCRRRQGSITGSFGAQGGAEGRLGPGIPVKEERVVDSLPRKMIQPTAPIVQVPESDARDCIGMLAEYAEELAVLFGLPLQHVWRTAIGVRIKSCQFRAMRAAVGPPSGSGDRVQIEFRHHNLQPKAVNGGNGLLEVLVRHGIQFVMSLNAHGLIGALFS